MSLVAIGWLATAVFAASYLFRSGAMLRRVQAAAALLWIGYGLAIHAYPVVAANVIVALAALGSTLTGASEPRRRPEPASPSPDPRR